MSDFLFVPLRPFFCAALAKRWKVKFRQGFCIFNNYVDSKTTYNYKNCYIIYIIQQFSYYYEESMKHYIYIYIYIYSSFLRRCLFNSSCDSEFHINNLKITSPGYDDIHPKIIKQICMIIAMPLSHIINCSLISGIVPSKLKIAKVIPIFKNGHRDDMYNYRPISVLPCFSKILEKIIANRLLSFWLKYNILYDHQF